MNKAIIIILNFLVMCQFVYCSNITKDYFKVREKETQAINDKDYMKVIEYYERLVQKHRESDNREILSASIFSIGEIYRKKLLKPQNSKQFYNKVINEYGDTSWAGKANRIYSELIGQKNKFSGFGASNIKSGSTNLFGGSFGASKVKLKPTFKKKFGGFGNISNNSINNKAFLMNKDNPKDQFEFVDPDTGLTFFLPHKNWFEIENKTQNLVCVFAKTDNTDNKIPINFNVMSVWGISNLNVPELYRVVSSNIEKEHEGIKPAGDEKYLSINGMLAIERHYYQRFGSEQFMVTQLIFAKDVPAFVMTFTAPYPMREEAIAEYRKIIDTLGVY